MADRKRVLVGVLGAPHGVRGEIRVKSYTADPAALARYRDLHSENGSRRFVILSWRPLKDDMGVARLEGVDNRDAAVALTNQKLYVERDRLPPPDEDEFYQADLVGLGAETATGESVGTVVAVQNYGAGDLLEIKPAGGGDTLLVAFTRAFVPVVDMQARRVVVAAEALDPDDGAPDGEPPSGDAA